MSDDTRIVYGAVCVWWDSIDKCGAKPSGLPCCPHCGGPLFECEDEETWWRQVDTYERSNGPRGYRQFVEWLRGKCFATRELAMQTYYAEGHAAHD